MPGTSITIDAVPFAQRLVAPVGIEVVDNFPFAAPQTPLKSALQGVAAPLFAVFPPLVELLQVQDQGPVAVKEAGEAVPTEQSGVVGAVLIKICPLPGPHVPSKILAVQLSITLSPFTPEHFQAHCFVTPVAVVRVGVGAVPDAQRLAVGFEATVVPSAKPQIPSALGAEQLAIVEEPLEPAHVQDHGPDTDPVTEEGAPAVQSRFIGAEVVGEYPLAVPHNPIT